MFLFRDSNYKSLNTYYLSVYINFDLFHGFTVCALYGRVARVDPGISWEGGPNVYFIQNLLQICDKTTKFKDKTNNGTLVITVGLDPPNPPPGSALGLYTYMYHKDAKRIKLKYSLVRKGIKEWKKKK